MYWQITVVLALVTPVVSIVLSIGMWPSTAAAGYGADIANLIAIVGSVLVLTVGAVLLPIARRSEENKWRHGVLLLAGQIVVIVASVGVRVLSRFL